MKQNSMNLDSWYLQGMRNFGPADYLLSVIAYHSSPVLEGEKPAVLLTFGNERLRWLNDTWNKNRNQVPSSGNFQYHELLRTPERTTVLFYNPELLQIILREDSCAQHLISCGYREELRLETALNDLKARYEADCPHEIGIFLGIPLPDVLGFINNCGKKAIAGGYWKIYHDPAPKLALFARYQEAKYCFIRFMMAGNRPGDYLSSKLMALAE